MQFYEFLLLISSVVTFASFGEAINYPPECPVNEIWDECSSNCQESCPTYLKIRPTPRCTDQCIKRCKCKPGYVRETFDQDSACVKQETCGPLSCTNPNEIWNNCGSRCEENCDMVTGLVPYRYCDYMCVQKCQCKPGYVRQSATNSTCVKKDQCSSRCGDNEDLYFDSKEICQDYCSFPDPPAKCNSIVGTPDGVCKCKDGYIWNSFGQCVSSDDCPVKAKCGPCKVWTDCGSACQRSCADVLGTREIILMCPALCKWNVCVCAKGTVKISDDDDRCVPESVCQMLFPPVMTTTTTATSSDESSEGCDM